MYRQAMLKQYPPWARWFVNHGRFRHSENFRLRHFKETRCSGLGFSRCLYYDNIYTITPQTLRAEGEDTLPEYIYLISDKNSKLILSMAPILTLHRVTTLEELKSLSYIGADAFRDDAGMSWFFPGGRDHPEDFVVAWKYLLLQDFLDRGKFILAAKVRDTDEGADGADGADRHPGRIVGFAVWERTGVCDAAKSWQGSSFSKSTSLNNRDTALELMPAYII